MALVENNYLKYDKNTHEYSITPEAVLNFLPYEDDELNKRVKNWKKYLLRWSNKIYSEVIYPTNQPDQREKLHYKIFLNIENEVNSIMDAMIEYVYEIMENEVDLDGLIPETVKVKLSNGNVLYQGYLNFEYNETYGTDF